VSKQVEAVHALRAMTAQDLDEHLREQRRRLFEVRFQQAAGQVENHRQIRALRREIARTMTLQIEMARGHRLASEAAAEVEPAPLAEVPARRRSRRSVESAAEPPAAGGSAAPDLPEAEAGLPAPSPPEAGGTGPAQADAEAGPDADGGAGGAAPAAGEAEDGAEPSIPEESQP
jgi:large subunit ribosomal protein L29